ncbi:MAG: exo-alpha-sialidase [Armatimonadia bacterium]|nr:exo-alpha-sialidase [Armatimonadia bacterium]
MRLMTYYDRREQYTMTDDFGFVVAEATPQNPRNTEGDIIELRDGTLLLAWSDFYGGEMPDAAPARISAKASHDRGKTWGERFTLLENEGLQNVMSVSFLRLDSGDILFFYLRKNGPDDLHAMVRRSSDEMATFSDPVRCTREIGYWVVNNARIMQLSDGRLVCPAAWHRTIDIDIRNARAIAWLSDDEGRTWTRGESELPLPGRGAMEPGVVELRDGRLLMIIRTDLGDIYRSHSADRGATWSDPEPMGVGAPVAPSTLVRIPSTGDLLLVWNDCFRDGPDAEAMRTPLTAAVSRDDGETWEYRRDLETDPELWYAYTSVTFVDDRALMTYWVDERYSEERLMHLKLRSVDVSWFYEA